MLHLSHQNFRKTTHILYTRKICTILKPWKAKAKDNWHFESWGDGNETKITWQNSGALPWPMARLMGPMIQKNLGHQFEQGLSNL